MAISFLFFSFLRRTSLVKFVVDPRICLFHYSVSSYHNVRCSQSEGNGSTVKRTVLHDLYEREGQSPWYDNLCRPVTDLLPLIASGVRGVTSNPAVIIYLFLFFCTFFLFNLQVYIM